MVKGNGLCNKQRLEARRKAWEEGEWVREAAKTHAEKIKSIEVLIKVATDNQNQN